MLHRFELALAGCLMAISTPASDPQLVVLDAQLGTELLVRYRVVNPRDEEIWIVCPEPRCARDRWPPVPFVSADRDVLRLSALLVDPPDDGLYEAHYQHELLRIAPRSTYVGVMSIPQPLETAVPYPSASPRPVDLVGVRRVELRLGYFRCLDAPLSARVPPILSPGDVLRCAGGRTAEAAQALLRAESALARPRAH
jgi:hypothetical protein